MSQGNKFGTFGGVFTPSILTILGVIMYLRLPWIVGTGGLFLTIGIILVAHIVSITTGLSVASMATDKRVKTGGPYYIISRSLGLPIGGTLGLALFVGLSFSVSLYVIGFSESFLSFLDLPTDTMSIRICGSITLLVVTAVTLISTAFAIKIQYVIMALIALSLISILGGSVPEGMENVEPVLHPTESTVSVALLFGIFFPAVTGFTAGVNMSGDLADPKRALPRGTMWAIGIGLLTYAGLAVFLAYRVSDDALKDPAALLNIALSEELVVAGIWGATLSSALGSILGAPRILQATAIDRITPKVFAKGHGRTQEPRNPLILTFGIAQLGILIGDLNAIAAIVSMFFITTYGFLNISCAIESWASPDFRPDFKIPRMVPIVGAVSCVVIMMQLDLFAMIAASAVLAGLFVLLKRRELALESGDTWEGVWSSLVRSGLHRLNRGGHERNWRPNVILFTHGDGPTRDGLTEFGQELISGRGVLTEFKLLEGKTAIPGGHSMEPDVGPVGVFVRPTPCQDPMEAMMSICRYHGFSGMEPNTLFLGMNGLRESPDKLRQVLDVSVERDFNTLLLVQGAAAETGNRQKIDIWWRPEAGYLRFGVTLVRYIMASPAWSGARLRFLIVCGEDERISEMRRIMSNFLDETRVQAEIRFIETAVDNRPMSDLVVQESENADLVLLGIPQIENSEEPLAWTSLADGLQRVLFVRASSGFMPLFRAETGRGNQDTADVPRVESEALEPLFLPSHPDLVPAVERFAERHTRLLEDFQQRYLRGLHHCEVDLAAGIEAGLKKAFGQVEKAFSASNPRRRRKIIARVVGGFLHQTGKMLDEFREADREQHRNLFVTGLDWAHEEMSRILHDTTRSRWISYPKNLFLPVEGDSATLRRFKRRRRVLAWLRGTAVAIKVPFGTLLAYYLEHQTEELLKERLQEAATSSVAFAIELRRLIESAGMTFQALNARLDGTDFDPEEINQERDRLLAHMTRIVDSKKDRFRASRAQFKREGRKIVNGFAGDLDKIDVPNVAKTSRQIPKESIVWRSQLNDTRENWFANQKLLLARVELELSMASLHHRLTAMVSRANAALSMRIQNTVVMPFDGFVEGVKSFRDELTEDSVKPPRFSRDMRPTFDASHAMDDLIGELHGLTGELVDSVEALNDEGLADSESDVFRVTIPFQIALRRLVEFVIQDQLVSRMQILLSHVALAETKAHAVAQDTMRRLSIALEDAGYGDEESQTPPEAAAIMGVVKQALEQLEVEQTHLKRLAPELDRSFQIHVKAITDRTNTHLMTELTGPFSLFVTERTESTLGDRIQHVMSGLGRGMQRVVTTIAYRHSAGLLYARGLTQSTASSIVPKLLENVNRHNADMSVVEQLPFYYRQLFQGHSVVDDGYWVGRSAELAAAKEAIENLKHGHRGAIFVVGRANSGKSALCRMIAGDAAPRENIHHLDPPEVGSCEPHMFNLRLGEVLHGKGQGTDMFAALPKGSVIIIHDLERWWERRSGGEAVITRLLNYISTYGDRCLFVVNIGVYAYRFINEQVPLEDHALAVIECGPMTARELKDVVLNRHGSTGFRMQLGRRVGDQVSEFALARYFTQCSEYSSGLVGVALRAWLVHLDGVDDEVINVRVPRQVDLDFLDALKMDWIAMLVQLLLHHTVDRERLGRITGLEQEALDHTIETLIRTGLVVETVTGAIRVNRTIRHFVAEYLDQRGFLL